MKVLVTGGSGFLGCHLVRRLLDEAHQVTLLVSPRFRPERLAGVEDRYTIAADIAAAVATRPAAVFHLASTPFNPPGIGFREHFRAIVGQTADLLEAFAGTGTRFIYTGSGAEYGAGEDLAESMAAAPATLLGGCKAASSSLVQAFGRLGEVHSLVLRLFTPYGPWEAPHRLIPSIVRSAQRGERVQLSSPDSTRDFVYAGDAVEAMLRAMDASAPSGAVVNICSGTAIRVRDMARLALSVIGNPVEIRENPSPRPDEIRRSSGSPRVASELLGWKPVTSLTEGIERTVSWFQQNPQWLRMPQ